MQNKITYIGIDIGKKKNQLVCCILDSIGSFLDFQIFNFGEITITAVIDKLISAAIDKLIENRSGIRIYIEQQHPSNPYCFALSYAVYAILAVRQLRVRFVSANAKYRDIGFNNKKLTYRARKVATVKAVRTLLSSSKNAITFLDANHEKQDDLADAYLIASSAFSLCKQNSAILKLVV